MKLMKTVKYWKCACVSVFWRSDFVWLEEEECTPEWLSFSFLNLFILIIIIIFDAAASDLCSDLWRSLPSSKCLPMRSAMQPNWKWVCCLFCWKLWSSCYTSSIIGKSVRWRNKWGSSDGNLVTRWLSPSSKTVNHRKHLTVCKCVKLQGSQIALFIEPMVINVRKV